jgi:hypothetical protein
MREATYSYAKNLFNIEQIKEININIKKNLNVNEVAFPSFTNHKVNKLILGARNTLALWMSGLKFR